MDVSLKDDILGAYINLKKKLNQLIFESHSHKQLKWFDIYPKLQMTLLLFSKDVETHHFKNKSKSNPALDTHNLTWLFMHVLKKNRQMRSD